MAHTIREFEKSCNLETQKSQWFNSVLVQRPKNQVADDIDPRQRVEEDS